MGSITGGPRDTEPPYVVNSKPLNYSSNFTGKRVEITFDEFINTNNINQELVISPPMTGKPDIRLKGKTLVVDMEGDLRENTTYTLNFGSSIEDLNERNVLQNYEFVFSTGDYLDSLSINGSIYSAFDGKPSEEPFIIMLYDILEDSIPMKEIPVFIGRSDKNGKYRINNLKADTFKVFALKDLNYNYTFDLPNEQIAFADSLVYLFPERLELINVDSLLADSVFVIVDSPVDDPDSLFLKGKAGYIYKPWRVDLLFFEEDSRTQYLVDHERIEDRHIFLSFNIPVKDTLIIKGIGIEEDNWFLKEVSASNDTFNLWVRDSVHYKKDTLLLYLSYPATDSAGDYMMKEDTLDLIMRQVRPQRGREKETVKPPGLTPGTIPNNSRLDFNKRLPFETNYPVLLTDTLKIHLMHLQDTLEISREFSITGDSLTYRKFYLDHSWESKEKYRIFAEPGAFTDIYGNSNDTLQLTFSIQDAEYYGVLFVNTSNVNCPVIVQLLSEKEIVLEERFIKKDTKVTFPFLKPGRYMVKYIYDINDNRKWDTGKYIEKRQPEKTEFYDGDIIIRSNWELEINWELKQDIF